MFSKKDTKIDKISTLDLTEEILSTFVAFLENMDFTITSKWFSCKEI